ncbi:MFS transporter [Leifsonia aquatica]|uniref:MFS transporter n=1 Tax=Leifsonia aquatica TaxID=144185 RepID=UPI00384B7983
MTRVGLRGQLGIFSVLFASGMWMSKVAQPLHYENAGALVAFGVGYAAMAITGGFSFVWGAIADRLGGLNAVRIGALVYAVGIAGRFLTDVAPTVAFSVIAGAGASLALVGIRPWVRSRATDEEIPSIVGGRNLGNQVGMFVGTVGAAALFAFVPGTDAGTLAALGVAPLLVVLGFVWLLMFGRTGAPVDLAAAAETSGRSSFRGLATKLAAIGVLSGFYVSLVTPYLPLFLTRGGLPDAAAAVVIAAMSFAQIAVTAVIARRGTRARPFRLFLIAESVTGLLTLTVALAVSVSPVLVAVLFIARAGFVAIAVTSEETIQYAVIPGNAAGFVFGISQTAFLIGDALGGALGAPLWTMLGPTGLATIAGAATLVNAILLPALLRTKAPARL